jgi:hypothetical protein
LIFEDCHVVNKDPIYAQILQRFKDTCTEWKPRILGLTSSVTATRCQNPAELESTITTLESKLDAVAETSTLIMSQRYGIWPKEQIYTCEKYEDTTFVQMLTDLKVCVMLYNLNLLINKYICKISKRTIIRYWLI